MKEQHWNAIGLLYWNYFPLIISFTLSISRSMSHTINKITKLQISNKFWFSILLRWRSCKNVILFSFHWFWIESIIYFQWFFILQLSIFCCYWTVHRTFTKLIGFIRTNFRMTWLNQLISMLFSLKQIMKLKTTMNWNLHQQNFSNYYQIFWLNDNRILICKGKTFDCQINMHVQPNAKMLMLNQMQRN